MPPKLNRMLMSSLVNEVEELTYLAQEIANSERSTVNNVELLTSWKFPSMPAIDVNAVEMLKECKGTAGELYLLLLELLYDRIHFVLGLLYEKSRSKSNEDTSIIDERKQKEWRTVPCLVKSIWQELRKRDDSCFSVERHRARYLDEARIALTSQLASLAESKIALEQTVIASRTEIQELRQQLHEKENELQQETRVADGDKLGLEEVAETSQRRDNNEDTTSKKNNGEEIASRSTVHVFPGDDPLADMKREFEANRGKIDDLLRQNDRISKVITRISEYRRLESRPRLR